MFFAKIMSKRVIYSFIVTILLLFSVWIIPKPEEKNDDFSEKAKIILRQIGNELLLSNQDSTSLIMPVLTSEVSVYELSFERELSFYPDSLVSIVKRNFSRSNTSSMYRVEVIQCTDGEVAYSYEVNVDLENTIIPCAGRYIPTQCYTIQFRFLDTHISVFQKKIFWGALIIVGFLCMQLFFRSRSNNQQKEAEIFTAIGSFRFYSEQNKLVKEATEINLSKKECELLEIFVANPNQIIKREDLTKRVWEDNGVFVGRSLDTYISKLRKKLQEDKTIKIINIHGVGYKLEC